MTHGLYYYQTEGSPLEKAKAELALLLLERSAQKLTQRELADELMISRTTLVKWLGLYNSGGEKALFQNQPSGRPALSFERKRFIAKLVLTAAADLAPASLRMIARRAKVSVATVSRIRKSLLERGLDLDEPRSHDEINEVLRRIRRERWLVTPR